LWVESAERLRGAIPPANQRALTRCERTLVKHPARFKARNGPRSEKVAKQAAQLAKLTKFATSGSLQGVARALSHVPPLRRAVYPIVGFVFTSRHVIRTSPIPVGAIAGMTAMNAAVYEYLWGASEWFATGPLREFDLTDRLHEIDVPMLVTSGAHEIIQPEHMEQLVAQVPDVQWELFADSAHVAVYEEPERYTTVLSEFLTKIDARQPAAPDC
jgi:pimeloyl-ACP methyl ester carboxylesterase